MPLPGGNGESPPPPPPAPHPLPFPSLIKLGRAVTARHVDRLLATLLRHRRHRLLAALASHALANAVAPTPRTHLLAASALLDSARPREAAQRLALASCIANRGRRLWHALLRRACAGQGDPRHALELLSAAVEDQGAVLSPSTYRVMVVGLCARGEVDGALRVFDVMTRRGCQVDDRVCSSIVSGFSRAGKAGAGLDFYERVRREFSCFEPGLVTLTSVVHALGLEGRIDEMAELMQEMECKGMDADAIFYGSMVHGYMSGGFLMEGLRKHRSMIDKGITADAVNYTTVIDGLCREGSVEKVMGFLDTMEQYDAKPNLITYTSLVGGFCKRGRLEDAFSILRKLEQTGVVVDEYVYSILIDSLCKMGDLARAFSLLEEMENKGIKAGNVTYNTVINGLCKAGDTEKAVEISEGVAADNFTYSTLLHGYINRDDVTGVMAIKGRLENSGISMDVVTCNVLIKALFMVNKVDDAWSLFHKMPEMGLRPNTITYNTIIDALCKVEEIDKALELFDEYKKHSSLSSTVVYDCLIKALCNQGKVDMAGQIFFDLVQKKIRPDFCNCRKLIHANFKELGEHGVLDFIYKVGELDIDLFASICNYASTFLSNKNCCRAAMDAYKLLRTQASFVTSKTCYRLLKSLHRNGSEEVIQPLLCEFIKIHGLHERRMINMLSCHLSKKSVREAIWFSNYMDTGSVPVSVLRGAVYTLKKQGEVLDACKFLKEAQQSGLSVDLAMYSIVVDGLCKGGYLEKALDLCERLKKEGLHPNIVIHNSVLSGLCQQGCLTEAFRLFDYLENSKMLPTMITYAILIGALCREGLLDDADQLFHKMSTKGIRPTTRVYNLLISGYCNFGLTEKALELMSHLEELFVRPDSFTLGAIISGLCLKGDTEAALRFFNEYRYKDIEPDFVGFMSLVKGLYAKGRMEESRGILREMFQCKEVVESINSVGDKIQAESLADLLSSACDQGRIDEIVTILNEVGHMLLSSSDSSSYNALGHLKKLQKADDACDSISDSGQVSPVAYDVSRNSHHRSSEVIDGDDSLSKASDDTDIDYQNLLGKSFSDDFDSYYTSIASLCSKGEVLRANKAVEAMIQNSD
ncbi:pentatricopeptide repeat-containing protein [Panicum miliaceum]|uniref:Pentatricopeptide repeat-containing protein n=1 Tax=Panicum miliaceum TaxID=4540 RepID=A0A3L6R1F4_PANMI|nr:pentatricopeptide repeat-containing protein [Panicum miliaceum]